MLMAVGFSIPGFMRQMYSTATPAVGDGEQEVLLHEMRPQTVTKPW